MGREITRGKALEGLGNPESWPQFAASVRAEFRAKPRKEPKVSAIKSTLKKLVKDFLPETSDDMVGVPVYAKSVRESRKPASRKQQSRADRKAKTRGIPKKRSQN